jgi:hypothetical protein
MLQQGASLHSGCIVDGQLVILDRAQSRYLMAPGGAHEEASTPPPHAGQSILLSWEHDRPLIRRTARESWFALASSEGGLPATRAGPLSLCRLAWLEKRAERRLRAGVAVGVAFLERTDVGDANLAAQARFVAAAWQSERLWSAQNRCLPRSLALASALRSAGGAARLVIGVRLNPFAAHAWVQDGTIVLNDTLDHVLLFTPILVA